MTARRYKVVFTPVGWHVIDTVEARDPMAQFGTGHDEYARACLARDELNEPPCDWEAATDALHAVLNLASIYEQIPTGEENDR